MDSSSEPKAPWKPLPSLQRRVLGVLVEKQKTTPDNYPLSLNSLVNGCNQKSNRDPQMEVQPSEAETAMEELRRMGAAAEVQGDSRVAKFRHYAHEWLGTQREELAVMAELLLRGPQTLGDLRARAARMDKIADIGELRPIVQSLMQKNLMVALTAEGRGQIVTHNLYLDDELAKLKKEYENYNPAEEAPAARPRSAAAPSSAELSILKESVAELRVEVAELRGEVARLRAQLQG